MRLVPAYWCRGTSPRLDAEEGAMVGHSLASGLALHALPLTLHLTSGPLPCLCLCLESPPWLSAPVPFFSLRRPVLCLLMSSHALPRIIVLFVYLLTCTTG